MNFERINITEPLNQHGIRRLFVFQRLFIASLLSIFLGAFSIVLGMGMGPIGGAVAGLAMIIIGGLFALLISALTGVTFRNMDDISPLEPNQAGEMVLLFEENPELSEYRRKVIEQGRPFYRFELLGLRRALALQKYQSECESHVRVLYQK